MDEKDLYWAAGFIEGEGCFVAQVRIDKRGYRSLYCRIQVTQVQREPLEKLQRIFDSGNINLHNVKYKGNRRPIFSWTINGLVAVEAVWNMFHILSPKRQEQAIKLLQIWNDYPHSSKSRHSSQKIWCRDGHHRLAEVGRDGRGSCKGCFDEYKKRRWEKVKATQSAILTDLNQII